MRPVDITPEEEKARHKALAYYSLVGRLRYLARDYPGISMEALTLERAANVIEKTMELEARTYAIVEMARHCERGGKGGAT